MFLPVVELSVHVILEIPLLKYNKHRFFSWYRSIPHLSQYSHVVF